MPEAGCVAAGAFQGTAGTYGRKRGVYSHPVAAAALTVLLLQLCGVASCQGQQDIELSSQTVYLKTGAIRVASATPSADTQQHRQLLEETAATGSAAWGSLGGLEQFLATLTAPVSQQTLAALTAVVVNKGGHVGSYIPNHTLLLVMPRTAVADVKALPGVVWIGDYQPSYKIATEWRQLLSWLQGRSEAQLIGMLQTPSQLPNAASSKALAFLRFQEVAPPAVNERILNLGSIGLAANQSSSSSNLSASLVGDETTTDSSSQFSRTDATTSHADSTSSLDIWRVVVLIDAFFPDLLPDHPEELLGSLNTNPGGANPGAAAAADWTTSIQLQCNDECEVSGDGRKLSVLAPIDRLQRLVGWLAKQPLVHWVAPRPKGMARNFFASSIGQSARAAPVQNALGQYSGDNGTHPIWDAGIQGQGQVVGMGDTGLDMTHCMFVDANVAFQTTSKDQTGVLLFDSTSHRKLRMYREYIDGVDANGHGTHCGGSAAGSLQSGFSPWQGMAPQAKLAFTDLGSGTAGSIYTPDDLANGYYIYPYSRGAYVHSDSWGTDSPQYDTMGFDVDLFSWVFQDFLPVFAAGNLGYLEIDSTVSSPATSKNCVAVGASLTSDLSEAIEQEALDLGASVYNLLVSGGVPGSNTDGVLYRVMLAGFGPSMAPFVQSGGAYGLTIGQPNDGCRALSRPSQFKGKVVLLQRGNCTFTQKVGIAQAAGAIAVIISNNINTGYMQMGLDSAYTGPTIRIPSASIPQQLSQPLWRAVQTGMQLTVQFQNSSLPSDRTESLAFFSSIGPTLDGRFKPDVIAPGTTISSAIPSTGASSSSGTCNGNLDVDRGTSMSTPIVAGALALIRQYFVDGFYPTGVAVGSHSFSPSAPLLKAVLLGGAVGMTGVTPSSNPLYNNVPLEPPPSTRQGFGRFDLQRSLPLPGISSWNLQVVDWVNLGTTADNDQYCVQATGGPLRITLAWADRPADPSAAVDLVNDLDLTVYADSLQGNAQKGNGLVDRRNNVEQVSFDNLNTGLVLISINAFNLPKGTQNYSLAVLGQFSGQLQSARNPAWDGTTTPCTLPVVSIATGPEGLTNSNMPAFTWTVSSTAPSGYQCKLSGQVGALTPAPLHNWAACVSGASLGRLLDGTYYFEVRATGYVIEDARLFTVDTLPPVTNLTSITIDPVLAPRTAVFAFTAYDNITFTFQCNLASSQAVIGDIWGVGTVGAWEDCASPQEYDSLTPGRWTFMVRAIDAAGNLQTTGVPQYNWTVALPMYPAIVGGTLGVVYSNSASFQFQAAGASVGAIAAATFQCKLQAYNGTDFLPAAFAPCTSPQVYNNLEQGAYQFSVGIIGQSAGQEAMTQLLVDVTGPVATITRKPPQPITQATTAQFTFSSEGGATFVCRLLTSAEQSPAAFNSCSSPLELEGLTDSRYTFQVAAVGVAGNMGPIAAFTFTVDTTGPVISNVVFTDSSSNLAYSPAQGKDGNWTVSVPQGRFGVSFDVTDGLLGSGVNTTYCRLKAVTITANTAPAGTGLAASPSFTICNSLSASYRVDLGQYGFVVYAVDQAGNYGHSPSYAVSVGVTGSGKTLATSGAGRTHAWQLRTLVVCALMGVITCLLAML